MKKNLQHVQLPNNMTETKVLSPQDLLVYLTIKRYMNTTTKQAFPSLQTISDKCGASINTIRKCISNLESEGYIIVVKEGRKNIYIFTKHKQFEPFSYDFLDKDDLSFTEKSYLAAAQQYMFKDNGIGKISFTNKDLSEIINMPESTISKCNRLLEKKDYLTVAQTKTKDPITGIYVNEKFFHLNELEQAIVFTLKDHEDRISENAQDIKENTKKIEELQKTIDSLIRDNKILMQEINKNKKLEHDEKTITNL